MSSVYKYIKVKSEQVAKATIKFFIEKHNRYVNAGVNYDFLQETGSGDVNVVGMYPSPSGLIFYSNTSNWNSSDEELFLPKEQKENYNNIWIPIKNKQEFDAAVELLTGKVEKSYLPEYDRDITNLYIDNGLLRVGFAINPFSCKGNSHYRKFTLVTTYSLKECIKPQKMYEVDGKSLTKTEIEAKISALELLIQ